MQFNISTILAITWCLTGAQAWIYATANVYGCVYYAYKPQVPIKVTFQTGITGTQCMTEVGSGGDLIVTQGGVSCFNFGEVQHKPYDTGLDNCVVREANWAVSYATNTSESGSTSSYWSANYKGQLYKEMYLFNQSPATVLCGSQSRCVQTENNWSYGVTPTLYLIFNPENAARMPSTSNLEGENWYIQGETGNQTAGGSQISRVRRAAGGHKL